jgi:hypothetical protein
VRFTLAVPRGRVVLKFFTPLGEVAGRDDVYRPVLDAMAVQPAGFDELLGLPAFGERGFAALVECLTLLVHSGQLLPLVAPPPEDVGAARRFNGAVIERARAGQVHDSLASPVTRTGIPVTDFGLLALSALFDGAAETADATARHALAALQRLGRRPHVHGQAIDDDGAALALLAERLRPVIEESVPLWRGLGMI